MQLGRQNHLAYQEGMKNSLQLAATEFHKIQEPKITKLTRRLSIDASHSVCFHVQPKIFS